MSDYHYPPLSCCGGLAFHAPHCPAMTELKRDIAKMQTPREPCHECRDELRAATERAERLLRRAEDAEARVKELEGVMAERPDPYISDYVALLKRTEAAEREAAAARAIIRTAGDMLQISVDIPQDLVTHVRLVTEEAAAARGELELGAPLHQAHCRIAELEAERDSLRAERDRLKEALEWYAAHKRWHQPPNGISTRQVLFDPPECGADMHDGWMWAENALEALRDGE